jgi:hypothetical protein
MPYQSLRRTAEEALAPRRPRRPSGFKEAQARIVADPLAAVFGAYGFACAFTGRDLRAEAAADPRGYLLVLGPDPLSTDPTLLIPATLDAIHAYERGHLALGPRYNFLVDMETIDPELLEALNPLGRLAAPSDPSFYPSQSAMTAHLIAFMRGRSIA